MPGGGIFVGIDEHVDDILVATPEPDATPPRMRLDITVPVGEDGIEARVYRLDPDGHATPVRHTEPADISSGEWVGYDYEAPYGTEVTYGAILTLDGADDVTDRVDVTLDVAVSWLIHVGQPALSCRLPRIRSEGARRRGVREGVFDVLGRADAVVKTDGVRRNPTSTLLVRTDTAQELADLLGTLADASILRLVIPADRTWGIDSCYIAISDVDEQRVAYGSHPGREFVLPYRIVGRPISPATPPRTWATLMAECETWADVIDLYADWAEALDPTA